MSWGLEKYRGGFFCKLGKIQVRGVSRAQAARARSLRLLTWILAILWHILVRGFPTSQNSERVG